MSVVAGVVKAAAGAKILTGARLAKKALPRTKRTLVVGAATLFVLAAFAALIPASETPKAENSSAASTNSQSVTEAPVSEPGAASQMNEEEAIDAYKKLPLSFIPNKGQSTDEAVRYYAQGAGYGFFFTKEGAMLSFANGKGRGGHALALDFLGADPDATLTAKKRLSGKVNYLVGDDPPQWQRGLQTHAELRYGGLWPGIDMAVRGEGGNLKYEFRLKPGSSVEDVRLGYRGAERLSVGARGELLVQTSLGVLKDAAPVSYQRIRGERVPVESRYRLLAGDGGYGFAVGSNDPRYPLVIDPGLDYSTFLGGADFDAGSDIAVRDGNAYLTGTTNSADYPTTPGAFDTTLNRNPDVFVTKLNATGSALAYSTFLGGTNFDAGRDIAVDESGRAYVTGQTASAEYPTTPGAFDTSFNSGSQDGFVTKLNATGSELVYSTFLGGSGASGDTQEEGNGIAVDESGRAYVTGITNSADYPTTPGAFDTTLNREQDVFVTKLNATGSALAYSTLLGGGGGNPDILTVEEGLGIAVLDRRAYVTGFTASADYPTTRGAFDTTLDGDFDAFVTKLNATGSALDYSTFLGGTNFDPFDINVDEGRDIAVDESGRAYVTGSTRSEADFPTTRGAFDRTLDGSQDGFVTKLNATGSALAYSTFLGGTDSDGGSGIAVNESGRAYVTGSTSSLDYPTTRGAFDRTFNGNEDAFVTKLPTG